MSSRSRLLAAIKGNPDLVDRLLMVAEPSTDKPTISSPDDAYRVLAPLLAGYPTERFAVVALDRKHRVIAADVITTGNDSFCIVDSRQIFRWALMQGRSGAAAVIIAHNHPSGDPTPSQQDREVTRRVKRAGEILGISLLDHIVIAGDTWDRV